MHDGPLGRERHDGEVTASGPPAEVLTPRLLADVYGVASEVATHPRTGAPQVTFLPEDARHGQSQDDENGKAPHGRSVVGPTSWRPQQCAPREEPKSQLQPIPLRIREILSLRVSRNGPTGSGSARDQLEFERNHVSAEDDGEGVRLTDSLSWWRARSRARSAHDRVRAVVPAARS